MKNGSHSSGSVTEAIGLVVVLSVMISICSRGASHAQEFRVNKVTDKITTVSEPNTGDQVVVESRQGLIVFDSFWSGPTARRFKEEIVKALGRDDFAYVIDMVDRLDMLGGNGVYGEAVIVGHDNILKKYGDEDVVESEITKQIDMWRHKEELSRARLEQYEAGTEDAEKEKAWMNKCKGTADELESGFSLVLPQVSYSDRMTLNLGDITIRLQWFGRSGNYSGQTVAVIPEEKVAILSKSIVYPRYHLAPGLRPDYSKLDVPRWIEVLEGILEGENAVDRVILCDDNEIYSREQMQSHLEYIRRLWNRVAELEHAGKTLQEIEVTLSLDKEFSFVKEMMAYKEGGDQWIRPQHELHTRLFFLQHKEHIASEILEKGGVESLQSSLDEIKRLGDAVYTDETSIWHLGYEWLNGGHVSEAIEVFKLYVEAYPESSNAYDSLAEAYMKKGDAGEARKCYENSLALNPENENAREKLEELK